MDNTNRDEMLEDLILLKIPTKHITLIKVTLAGSRAMLRVKGEPATTFKINGHVSQGDTLSTISFKLMLESTTQTLKLTRYICTQSAQLCEYSDVVTLIVRNKSILTKTLINLGQDALGGGLKINKLKTKYMEVKKTHNDKNYTEVRQYKFELLKRRKYGNGNK